MTELILFGSLALMIFINIPIAIALGLASIFTLLYTGDPLGVVPAMMQATVQKFTLLTIPLFILAGALMDKGGISKRLINLANCFFGGMHGGMGIVAVIAAMFFAAISGSGTATVAAIGSILIPAMVKEGYDSGFSSGLSAISGSLGTIIPPSITFIIYGMITGESIGDLFFAGIVPGCIFGGILCIYTYWISKKNNWGGKGKMASGQEIMKCFIDALWGIISPVIVLGGIYSGILTPTESAAVAVIYSFVVGVFIYRELPMKDLMRVIITSGKGSAMVLFIIATSTAFSWLFTYAGISQQLIEFITSMHLSATAYCLIVAIILLIFGFFLEGIATCVLMVPLLWPVAESLGVNVIHFGMIVSISNVIGTMTPPVAVNLFAASSVTHLKMGDIAKGEIPFFLGFNLVFFLIVLVPWFSTALS